MTVVCIAGMHRSGTSMVARLLNLCGVYLGEEKELMPATQDNADGYWENLRFVEINNSLLAQLNGSWALPPSADSSLEMQKQPLVLIEKAQELIQGFKAQPVWGWKDPRNSLTLPFWQQLIPGLKIINCVRNPLEVADSLARRDKFPITFSLELWHTYNQRLLSATTPGNLLTTHYGIYFINPQDELRRLLEFIGIEADKKKIETACAAAKPSLKHNRRSLEYLIAEGAPLKVVNSYALLCSQAGSVYWNAIKKKAPRSEATGDINESNIDHGLLRGLFRKDPVVLALAAHIAKKEQMLQVLTAQVGEKEQTVQALTAQVGEKEQTVQALTAQVGEKEQTVQALAAQVGEKEQTVQALTAQVGEKEHRLQMLSTQAEEREKAVQTLTGQLSEITLSKAWRFAMLIRGIRVQLLPAGSLREKTARIAKNLILHPRSTIFHYSARLKEIILAPRNRNKAVLMQNTLIGKIYSKNTSRLILFLVPGYDIVNGGIMSICSLGKVSEDLKSEHQAEVITATLPGHFPLIKYSMFENHLNIFRFDQILPFFDNLSELIIHIPECYLVDFLREIKSQEKASLKNISNLQINILLQNIWLMPSKDIIDQLREFTDDITSTTAHTKYCTQELREKYNIPIHHFSTNFHSNYEYQPYEGKEDLLIVSPDTNIHKEAILKCVLAENEKIKLHEIKNMRYGDYKRLVSRAKWVITFGEGLDGYFIEGTRSGAIPFAVYNSDFFSEHYKNLPNIYRSYEEMLQQLPNDIKKLDNPVDFSALSRLLIQKDKLEYNETKYRENVRDFYFKKYTLP